MRTAAIGSGHVATSFEETRPVSAWVKAEASFRRTLQLDGSLAKYHAALGSVLLLLNKWEDAEAEYTAAVLLDLDNADYRKMVKRARSRR